MTARSVLTLVAGAGRAEAIAQLKGADSTSSGSVFLAGSKPSMTFTIDWRRGRSCQWYAELDAKLAGKSAHCAALSDAVAAFFARFPAQFAAVAPSADWDARHWLVEEFEDGGESRTKVGLDLNGHLPGIFWWTLFGRDACAFFGRETLLAAPAAQALDLGAVGGVALRSDLCPQRIAGGRHSAAEASLREFLGRDYFFDIRNPRRRCTGLPGVSQPGD